MHLYKINHAENSSQPYLILSVNSAEVVDAESDLIQIVIHASQSCGPVHLPLMANVIPM